MVMTRNILFSEKPKPRHVGFAEGPGAQAEAPGPGDVRGIQGRLARVFRLEFLARIDACIPFRPLTEEARAARAKRKVLALFEELSLQADPSRLPLEDLPALAAACLRDGEGARGIATPPDRDLAPKLREAADEHGGVPFRFRWD